MLLRETMWEIFLSTGNIDAYLAYRACLDCPPSDHRQQLTAAAAQSAVLYHSNQLVSEVRWH